MIEDAILVVSILTLVVAAATLVLIWYDVGKRHRPKLDIQIRRSSEKVGSLNEELTIGNKGTAVRIEQIYVCAQDGHGSIREKIWEGNSLLETNGVFATTFFIDQTRVMTGIYSYVVEVKYSGQIEERVVARETSD